MNLYPNVIPIFAKAVTPKDRVYFHAFNHWGSTDSHLQLPAGKHAFNSLSSATNRISASFKIIAQDLPGGPGVKNPPAGDTGLIPGPGRSYRPWGN